jgi:hypothetical protein
MLLGIAQPQKDRRTRQLESSVALLQASSGLEKLMVGSKGTHLQDTTVAQISAALYYQSNVIAKLMKNAGFKNKFQTMIYDQLNKDFGDYIDAQARIKPKSLHHVYEWKKTGQESARLFKLNKLTKDGLSFQIAYEFKLSKSKVPKNKKSKSSYVFANKAFIMELGKPITISPKASKRLVFEVNGYTVFMPKGASVVVRRPGGTATTSSFKMAYQHFFKSNLVSLSIKKSGFQSLFNGAMAKALSVPGNIKKVQYSFSPNAIRSQADAALVSAFGGAML